MNLATNLYEQELLNASRDVISTTFLNKDDLTKWKNDK